MHSLTIDVGRGNPGAGGLKYHTSNMGTVENVAIRSSDPALRGAVYIGAGRTMYALDAESGRERWRLRTGGTTVYAPAVVGRTVLFTSGDGCLYAAGEHGLTAIEWAAPVVALCSPSLRADRSAGTLSMHVGARGRRRVSRIVRWPSGLLKAGPRRRRNRRTRRRPSRTRVHSGSFGYEE